MPLQPINKIAHLPQQIPAKPCKIRNSDATRLNRNRGINSMEVDFDDVLAQAFASPTRGNQPEEGGSPTSLPAWLQKSSLTPLPWRAPSPTRLINLGVHSALAARARATEPAPSPKMDDLTQQVFAGPPQGLPSLPSLPSLPALPSLPSLPTLPWLSRAAGTPPAHAEHRQRAPGTFGRLFS